MTKFPWALPVLARFSIREFKKNGYSDKKKHEKDQQDSYNCNKLGLRAIEKRDNTFSSESRANHVQHDQPSGKEIINRLMSEELLSNDRWVEKYLTPPEFEQLTSQSITRPHQALVFAKL